MNKQEAMKKLTDAKHIFRHCWSNDYARDGFEEGINFALETVNKLDEPEKLVVPQFVADWYERNKDDLNTSIYSTITRIFMKANDEDLLTAFESWLMCNENSIVTVVSMHQLGYEVEKEKLYTVEIPNPNASGYSKTYLCKNEDDKVELFTWSHYTSIEYADNWKQLEPAQLTEAEIKKDFDWAWQFAEEVDE